MTLKNTQKNIESTKQLSSHMACVFGVAFTFFIALLGYVLSIVPGFSLIGQLACAIIIAVAYRQIFGYPEKIRQGIHFSSKRLLSLSIILYILYLNINIVLSDCLHFYCFILVLF